MTNAENTKVIPLRDAPGSREAWTRPIPILLLWILVEYIFVTNPLQLSSRIRGLALKSFGAKIGKGVILRPRLRVKFPWNLEIGNDCWIGEGVWIHNQDKVTVGHDVSISQETFITTGTHNFRKDMGLSTKPIVIEPGVWICSRAIITSGVTLGKSSVVPAGTRLSESLLPGEILGRGRRFD
jgi:putative colanic acid biosynthesis acetyltransferase WcaF